MSQVQKTEGQIQISQIAKINEQLEPNQKVYQVYQIHNCQKLEHSQAREVNQNQKQQEALDQQKISNLELNLEEKLSNIEFNLDDQTTNSKKIDQKQTQSIPINQDETQKYLQSQTIYNSNLIKPKQSRNSFNQMIDRFNNYQEIKSNKLKNFQEQNINSHFSNFKMNQYSKKLIESMGGILPIQQRTRQIIKKKQEWVKKEQQTKQKNRKQKQQQQFEQMKKYQKFGNPNYDQYFKDVKRWIEKRDQAIQIKKKEKELKNKPSFIPQISQRSRKLAQKLEQKLQIKNIPFNQKAKKKMKDLISKHQLKKYSLK